MKAAKLSDIEILTHCDINRLSRVYLMAKTVPDEVLITLVIGYSNPNDKKHLFVGKPDNLNIYFEYFEPGSIYPTNAFRNIAFENSRRDYILYLDIDFIFQFDFWINFQKYYIDLLSKSVVICPIPLFDEFMPDYLKDFEPDELCKKETVDTYTHILNDNFAEKSKLFKFHEGWVSYPQKEQLADMTPKMRQLRNATILPEPWGILHRESYLFADEDFFGRVKDKQQFVCRLLDSGLKFYSMRDCVMYHLWHPDSRYDINREKENCTNTLLFNNRYLHKYQNFYFLLCSPFEETRFQELLNNFEHKSSVVEIDENLNPDDVIPILKQRNTIISKAQFHPEYSVYGYKFVLVYDSSKLDVDAFIQQLGTKKTLLGNICNLGFFSMELDLADNELNLKKIQNLSGWKLNDTSKNRVNLQGYDHSSNKIINLLEQFKTS